MIFGLFFLRALGSLQPDWIISVVDHILCNVQCGLVWNLNIQCKCQSKLWLNHRISQVGKDLKRSSHPEFCGKGSLESIICHLVQLHLENLQERGPYHMPEDVVPVSDCSYHKNIYVEMKHFPLWLVPIAPCFLLVASCKERTSILSVANFQVLGYCDWCLLVINTVLFDNLLYVPHLCDIWKSISLSISPKISWALS